MNRYWRSLVVLVLVAAGCSSDGLTNEEYVAEAFERQPPALLTEVTELRVGDGAEVCGVQESYGLAVDLDDGSLIWRVPLPTPPGPIAVIDDIVYASSVALEEYPPSVAALDAQTGDPLWQRFFDSQSISVLEAPDRIDEFTVMVKRAAIAIDAAGEASEISDYERPPARPGVRYGGVDYVAAGGSLIQRIPAGAELWSIPLPIDSEFTAVKSIDANADRVLVRLSSPLGPNNRIVVVNAETGQIRWTLDGVRDAQLAGDEVLYDRRVNAAELPVREVVSVSADDPEDVRWSMPSSGRLGGYIGSAGGTHWFAVSAADPGSMDIVGIGPGRPPVEQLLSNRPDAARSWQIIVEEDLVAVVTTAGILWRTLDGPIRLFDEHRPIASIARHGASIIAVHGSEQVFCF